MINGITPTLSGSPGAAGTQFGAVWAGKFKMGFQSGNDTKSGYERMKNKVNEELKQHFRPEFLNRIDEVIVFRSLDRGAELLRGQRFW